VFFLFFNVVAVDDSSLVNGVKLTLFYALKYY